MLTGRSIMVRNTMVVLVPDTGGMARTRSMTSASSSVSATRTFSR